MLYIYIYIYIYMRVCIYIVICICIFIFIYLFIYLSIYLSKRGMRPQSGHRAQQAYRGMNEEQLRRSTSPLGALSDQCPVALKGLLHVQEHRRGDIDLWCWGCKRNDVMKNQGTPRDLVIRWFSGWLFRAVLEPCWVLESTVGRRRFVMFCL